MVILSSLLQQNLFYIKKNFKQEELFYCVFKPFMKSFFYFLINLLKKNPITWVDHINGFFNCN